MLTNFNSGIILSAVLSLTVSFNTYAAEKDWYFVWESCANCDKNGDWAGRTGEKAPLRAFISTPVYAGPNDYDCKRGAFYNETGINGNLSAPYKSEGEVKRRISEQLREYKDDNYVIHRVYIPKYCD